MTKNDFRAIPMFKIIIRICMKNVEFCRKTSKCLPKRCLLIFYIFYLNEKENPTSMSNKIWRKSNF